MTAKSKVPDDKNYGRPLPDSKTPVVKLHGYLIILILFLQLPNAHSAVQLICIF